MPPSIIQVLFLTVPVGAAPSIPCKASVCQCKAVRCTHSNLSTVIMLPLRTVLQISSIPVRHSKTFTRRITGPTSRVCIRPSLTCILGHLHIRIRCQRSPSDLTFLPMPLHSMHLTTHSMRRARRILASRPLHHYRRPPLRHHIPRCKLTPFRCLRRLPATYLLQLACQLVRPLQVLVPRFKFAPFQCLRSLPSMLVPRCNLAPLQCLRRSLRTYRQLACQLVHPLQLLLVQTTRHPLNLRCRVPVHSQQLVHHLCLLRYPV